MRTLAASLLPLALLACSSPTPAPAADAAPDLAADVVTDVAPDAAPDAAGDAAGDAAPDTPAGPPHVTWEPVDLPAAGPLGRWGIMIADVGDGTAFVYGGTTLTAAGGGSTSSDLWRFDGRGDAPSFERVAAAGSPPRYCGCVGYLPDSQTVLMIGGRNPNEAPAETWAMREGAWSQLAVPTTPPGVIGCAMAWSRERGALYLFGGGGMAAGFSSRIWRYDPSAPAWVMLDATGPRGRYDDALVPLPDGRTLLMVAGARGAQAGTGFYNDVWRFDTMAETWQQVTITGEAPPGRRSPWVSVDADGGGIVVALGSTGIQAGEVLDDAWHLDLAAGAWARLEPETLPPARGFSMALPGRGAVRGYLFGGFDNARPIRDAWRMRAL
ncbi:MAG: hypothetical protein U0324_28030 [Polyangiales bacterium]